MLASSLIRSSERSLCMPTGHAGIFSTPDIFNLFATLPVAACTNSRCFRPRFSISATDLLDKLLNTDQKKTPKNSGCKKGNHIKAYSIRKVKQPTDLNIQKRFELMSFRSRIWSDQHQSKEPKGWSQHRWSDIEAAIVNPELVDR